MVDIAPNLASKFVRNEALQANFYLAYYEGEQPLTYTTRKYRDVFARMVAQYQENMCPAVIDPVVDRLEILGLEVEGSDANSAGKELWRLWQDGYMVRRSRNIHQKALQTGNSYAIVWPDEKGTPIISPQYSDNFYAHYTDETGLLDWATKCWLGEDKFHHVTIFYSDRIERWQSSAEVNAGTANYDSLQYTLLETKRNAYSRIPVFHFANNAPKGAYGISDLKDVTPVQDALNKAVADLLIAMEFAAYNQRWATGIEIEDSDGEEGIANPAPKKRFQPGIDRMFATENENAKFGEFTAADLDKFISVHDMFVQTIARVTGTPMHYMLFNTSLFPSGESLKTAEQRFVSKVKDRQVGFGETWEELMTFAAEVAKIELTERIDIKWQLAAPRSETEFNTSVPFKIQMGISKKQLQREAGYTEAQIEQMEKENTEAQEQSLETMQKAAINPNQDESNRPDNRTVNSNGNRAPVGR